MTMRIRAVVAAALAAALTLGCCACSSSRSAATTTSITVFAASSLTEAFTALGKAFEAAHPGTRVRFDFGASSALAVQINQGAPADVFASASTKNMQQVIDAKGAASSVDFATNVMEVAVPRSNPGHVAGLSDLARAGIKVALCEPQVPCGATAAKVFANAELAVKPVTLEPDVKSVLAKVQLGEVDAGIVYVTDVRAAGAKVTGVEISPDVNASTTYPIAALTKAQNASVATAFVDFVLGAQGRAVLLADGFRAP